MHRLGGCAPVLGTCFGLLADHKSALTKQSLSFLSSGVQKVFVPKILRAEIARAAAELIFRCSHFKKR
jgi:hypothetical protein